MEGLWLHGILVAGWLSLPGAVHGPADGPGPVAADLAGDWLANVVQDGQQAQFAVRIEATPGGELRATLSLPTIDAWDVVTVAAVLEGRRLRIGDLEWTVEDDTITGVLPSAFVPVHRIPFELHRVPSLERPAPAEIHARVVEPAWEVELSSPVWAGLACDGEKVFVGTDAGELVALDAADGQEWWRFAAGGSLRARPTVIDGMLYVHADDGWLYALEAEGGQEVWRAPLSGEGIRRVPPGEAGSRYDHYASSPALAGGRLFVGESDGKMRALDAATGELLWSFSTSDTVASSPAVAADLVVFGSFDGRVYALRAESGELVWRHETGAAVPSSPLVASGRVILGSRSYDLVALELDDGAPSWSHYCWYSWIESSAVSREGVAYVGTSDAQQVLALDLEDGSVRWTFDSGGSVWSDPAATQDTVFAGTAGVADYLVDHQARVVAIDRDTGAARWQFPRERPGKEHVWGFPSSPALGEEYVYFADLEGRVYAFDVLTPAGRSPPSER